MGPCEPPQCARRLLERVQRFGEGAFAVVAAVAALDGEGQRLEALGDLAPKEYSSTQGLAA
jgi:hypothetical protein